MGIASCFGGFCSSGFFLEEKEAFAEDIAIRKFRCLNRRTHRQEKQGRTIFFETLLSWTVVRAIIRVRQARSQQVQPRVWRDKHRYLSYTLTMSITRD